MSALNFGPNEQSCLAILSSHRVEYLLVGGYAVRFHGHNRPTKDVDVLVNNDAANSVRLCAALVSLIGPHPNFTPDQIEGRKRQVNFVQWGYAFEVLTAADGVEFSQAYARRVVAHAATLEIPVISKVDLIAMKQRAGRTQDIEDAQALGAV